MKSRIGIILTFSYLFVVIAFYVSYILNPRELFSGFPMLLLALPWSILVPGAFSSSSYLDFSFFTLKLSAINAIILYFIGLGISKLIAKSKKSKLN